MSAGPAPFLRPTFEFRALCSPAGNCSVACGSWSARTGGYYVAGTRIALDSLIRLFKNGASPETILRSFPLIGSLESVYGAPAEFDGEAATREARGCSEADLKVRLLADANLDQDIVAGLLRRQPEIDFELAAHQPLGVRTVHRAW